LTCPPFPLRSSVIRLCLSGLLLLTPGLAAAQSGPLAIHIGDTDLLIGGFMDATVITRSTNVSSGIGTSFGSIPFSNTTAGNLSETRFSSQNSRLSLQATSKVGGAALKGYVEADFLGNAPPI
jgi:hypothetical protein